MAFVPDMAYDDLKHELISEKGVIKHAAFTLYGYYCRRRNKETGVCFPSLKQSALDTGIPLSNISQLKDFLEEKFWILCDGKLIRPLKGFYSLEFSTEENGKKFLTIRNEFLTIRNEISNKLKSPIKEVLNQQNEPAHLTKGAGKPARPPKVEIDLSAKKKNGLSLHSGVTKPQNGRINSKDARISHPAVAMVKEISGKYPHKDLWDKIIRELRDNPDTEFFQQSFEIWRSFDGNPMNLDKWLFEPNKSRKLPQRFESKNGSKKPIDVAKNEDFSDYEIELDERDLLLPGVRETVLQSLREMAKNGNSGWAFDLENAYHPDDWKWLMENLNLVEQKG